MKSRVLFICKKGHLYSYSRFNRRSSGLFNSTRYIVEALQDRGVHAHIVEVIDNNDIDREVFLYRPDLVIVEALWVIPEKFQILKKLHPRVKWYVHLHSNIPFLALEGMAIEWIRGYAKEGVHIIANSEHAFEGIRVVNPDVVYLPNVYIPHFRPHTQRRHGPLKVACYGAIRPMKNQLTQAIAAIKFANEKGRELHFHINATRVEKGEGVARNLEALFKDSPHKLVKDPWFEPCDFINQLRDFDIGMQVSLSETFNVVSADYVTAGVPVVASPEVHWLSFWSHANPASVDNIAHVMHTVYRNWALTKWNQHLLRNFSHDAQNAWYHFVRNTKRHP